MDVDKKDIALQKSLLLSLILWLSVTTFCVAPYNPPGWANGILYIIWWVLVMWTIMIISTLPIAFIVILSFKLFKLNRALFSLFCFVWFFDHIMTKNYPMFSITPGVVLSALYVFVFLKEKGAIKI